MTKKKLNTASGRPYFENEDSMTVGPRGPILLQDSYLHEKLAHFNRERIPERVWVKFHFTTQQGIRNLTGPEAQAMKGKDPDYAQRDLVS